MKIKKISGTAVLDGNVVDSLDDNSTTNAPSQRAVNEAIKLNIITNGVPVKTGRRIDGKDEYIVYITFTTPSKTNTFETIYEFKEKARVYNLHGACLKGNDNYFFPSTNIDLYNAGETSLKVQTLVEWYNSSSCYLCFNFYYIEEEV